MDKKKKKKTIVEASRLDTPRGLRMGGPHIPKIYLLSSRMHSCVAGASCSITYSGGGSLLLYIRIDSPLAIPGYTCVNARACVCKKRTARLQIGIFNMNN